MRRLTWIVTIIMGLSMLLVACGKKDAGSVMQDLDRVINNLKSYKATGKMVLHTGQDPQEFDVQVWYQKPHYYRIVLKNTNKDVTQIILRNDEGVFVLTPHLNKSFRFQSNWPDNQAQVYLYQSLANSIIADKNRQFVQDNGTYVFDVLANYQNASMARQKIWLEPKTYAPKRVEVSDTNGNVLIGISFDHFEFDNKFEKDSFEMQRNLTSWQIQTLPTLTDMLQAAPLDHTVPAQTGSSENPAASGQVGSGQATAGQTASDQTTGQATSSPTTSGQATSGQTTAKLDRILEPSYLPAGVTLQDVRDLDFGGVPSVMSRYSGTYHFTLLQHRPLERTVSIVPADPVDLGFTYGVISGEEYRTLTWTDQGIEFRLSSGDMTLDEMVKVAASLEYEMGK